MDLTKLSGYFGRTQQGRMERHMHTQTDKVAVTLFDLAKLSKAPICAYLLALGLGASLKASQHATLNP